jgi:hypothetical protein
MATTREKVKTKMRRSTRRPGAASCFICELAADQLDTDSRSDLIEAAIRVALLRTYLSPRPTLAYAASIPPTLDHPGLRGSAIVLDLQRIH